LSTTLYSLHVEVFELKFKYFCEELDGIAKLDIGSRGVIHGLYPAARLVAGAPLTEALSDWLSRSIGPTLLVTGFRVLPLMVQETDGPPGVAVLAKVVSEILERRVVVAVEEPSVEILKSCLESVSVDAQVSELPVSEGLEHLARELFDSWGFGCVVFVEKAGCNDVGVYHNMMGVDVSRHHAKAEAILHEAKRRGVGVFAIGDGGNEVGMGLIRRAVELYVPRAKRCGCPCGRGIASCSKADLVLVASTSNIGCYALAAAISARAGVKLVHSAEDEFRLIKAALEAGAVDGMTGRREMRVDGVPVKVTASIVEVLAHMTSSYLDKTRATGSKPSDL